MSACQLPNVCMTAWSQRQPLAPLIRIVKKYSIYVAVNNAMTECKLQSLLQFPFDRIEKWKVLSDWVVVP